MLIESFSGGLIFFMQPFDGSAHKIEIDYIEKGFDFYSDSIYRLDKFRCLPKFLIHVSF